MFAPLEMVRRILKFLLQKLSLTKKIIYYRYISKHAYVSLLLYLVLQSNKKILNVAWKNTP